MFSIENISVKGFDVICPGLGWGLASCMSVGLRAVAGRLEMPGLGGGSFLGVSELPAQSGTPFWVGIGVLRCFARAQW